VEPLRLDRPGSHRGPGGAPDPARDEAAIPTKGRRLLCGACRSPVTTSAARTEVSGDRRHTFCNPHGLVFEIECFAEAPGAASLGPPEHSFSWFPGYPWRAAVCRACRVHLGWSYGDEDFWGLIVDRLIEEDGEES
jgi:hypothetical protein